MKTAPSTNACVALALRRRPELLELLTSELEGVHASMLGLEKSLEHVLDSVHPSNARSARNLLHYVALRRHDLRELQGGLASLGLSSLGRAESHVHDNLDQVLALLHQLQGHELPDPDGARAPVTAPEGRTLLREHTDALLGPRPRERSVRIMVTLPSEAATDAGLVRSLLSSGMDVARINCAHDDHGDWTKMIANLRAASAELSRPCEVLMDLSGPKVRTGRVAPGPRVVSWHPGRDTLGEVVEPARIFLGEPLRAPAEADAVLPIPAPVREILEPGDRLHFLDARGKKRSLRVSSPAWATADQTAYVVPATRVRVRGASGKEKARFEIASLPAREGALEVAAGDLLVLTRSPDPGVGNRIPLTLPEAFGAVRPGHSVWFDDGRIGGTVEAADDETIKVRITQARAGGDKLRADKGVNFPDTELPVPALGPRDIDDLEFVARNADMVGLSFVRDVHDVRALREHLVRLGRPDLGVVLKIETRRGFEELPALLLAAMASPRSGVMIARGDLAVELGYQRLAEVQEEILWMCEAAHMPVIWATQVLEGLAKKGKPSRSEITDAAMGVRAECVMLNKGPHVVQAVRTLDDILHRMERHQSKKRSMLRALELARAFAPAKRAP
ncbi:MAG TPA: pyruvate kinase [Planctomycetota bacterium]|nr:pyruvate kinase [Planctomycetota bacterium]